MRLFNQISNNAFGLDISNLTLKLCETEAKGKIQRLQAISRIDIPKGIIEGGVILKQEEFVKALKKLINEPLYGKVLSRNVVASLPEEKTFIKLIELGRNPNSLKEIIASEVEKNIPMPITEMYLDWQVITDSAEKKLILVAACPKIVVDKYVETLTMAGLSVQALEIESIATCRALLLEEATKTTESKECYIIADIGGQSTNIIAYAQGVILFSVSVPIASDKVTERVAEALKIDLEQAEKAKIVCGLNPDKAEGIVKHILEAITDQLLRKINEIIRFQAHHYPSFGKVSKIILTGGGANTEHLDEFISKATNLPVELGSVFTNLSNDDAQWIEILKTTKKLLKFPEFVSDSKNNGSSNYTTAIGLALRDKMIQNN
ncbi:MAG: type IV pilus assembly protein PilM [bacterium]